MGCAHLCQNSELIDNKVIISDKDNRSNNNRSINQQNNNNNNNNYALDKQHPNNARTRNKQSVKNETENYKCSINIVDTIIGNDSIKFDIIASNVHKMVPVWVEKDKTITFTVDGFWGFMEKDDLFNSMGCDHFEEKPNNMNFGCLVGYINNSQYFSIYNGLSLETSLSGPLYLFQNNGLYSVNPKGSLTVEIKGAMPMSIYDIEKNNNWDLDILDTSIPEMKEDEQQLLILLNKVRTNPKLFVQKYLNIENPTDTEQDLINILNTIEPLQRLTTNKALYKISINHALDLGKNQLAGHISSEGLNMEQRLRKNNIKSKVFAENCIFGYNDPREIILKLLIDEDNEDRNQRKIILNDDFNKVGVTVEPHEGEFCWSCIQDFVQDEDN